MLQTLFPSLPPVILDKEAGFCKGVDGALRRLMRQLSKGSRLVTDGEIIHNSTAMNVLKSHGLAIQQGDTQSIHVIRTHSCTRQRLHSLKTNGNRILNLTCKNVSFVQSRVKKYSSEGYHCIISGHSEHPEVLSLASYAPSDRVSIIHEISQIESIPYAEKYLMVSQTTFSTKLFTTISDNLREKLGDRLIIINTICDAASSRQNRIDAINEQFYDTVVVVGGHQSSNTQKLAHRAQERGFKTFHVESAGELRHDFSKSRGIYVTAGASTPAWIISECVRKIKQLRLPLFYRVIAQIFDALVSSIPLVIAFPFAMSLSISDFSVQTVLLHLFVFCNCSILAHQQAQYRSHISHSKDSKIEITVSVCMIISILCVFLLLRNYGFSAHASIPLVTLSIISIIASKPFRQNALMRFFVFESLYPALLLILRYSYHDFSFVQLLLLSLALPFFMIRKSANFSQDYLIERSPFIYLIKAKPYFYASVLLFTAINITIITLSLLFQNHEIRVLALTAASIFIFSVYLYIHRRDIKQLLNDAA